MKQKSIPITNKTSYKYSQKLNIIKTTKLQFQTYFTLLLTTK